MSHRVAVTEEKGQTIQIEAPMGRREFTVASVLELLSGVAITLSGCSSDSGSSPAAPIQTPAADNTGTVSANHGHTAVVTGAMVTSAGAVNLNIQGTAAQPHTVALSAAEVQQVGAGQRVSKASSTDNGHDLTVTFN